jgi:hypothetical protein
MEADKNKHIEDILKKAMKSSKIERPSPNFTDNIMSKVEALEAQKISYQPLISKKSWVTLSVLVLLIVSILLFRESDSQSAYLEALFHYIKMDLSFINFNSNFNIPEIFMYGILLFGLLFGIQIVLIKYFYVKRNNILNL